MKTDDIIKDVILEENFIPNKLMPLEGSDAKLGNSELLKKRGYTLKAEVSNIKKVYEKQATISIL